MIEIPILFNYRLGDRKSTGRKYNHALYRSTTFQAGVKLTRLIGSRTVNRGFFDQLLINPVFNDANLEFQDFDVAVVGGFTFRIGLKGAIYVQHSLSVRGLYKLEEVEAAREVGIDVSQLRPYSLTIGGKYVFY